MTKHANKNFFDFDFKHTDPAHLCHSCKPDRSHILNQIFIIQQIMIKVSKPIY